jgi:hypothetical protein
MNQRFDPYFNNETNIDIGGICGTCDDNILNADETSIDLGGRCGNCFDFIQNGDETDIDYGGTCGYCMPDSDSVNDGLWRHSIKSVPFNFSQCKIIQAQVTSAFDFTIFIFFVLGVLAVIVFIIFIWYFWGFIMAVKKLRDFLKEKKEKTIYNRKPKRS